MPGMMDPSMMFNGMDMMSQMSQMMGMGMGMGPGGMMNGGFGGPGGFNGQNGYNNQNYGNPMNQNFRNDRGFGGRPYGRGARGRGFGFNRGRGGYGYNNNFNQGPQQNFGPNQHMMSQQQQGPGDMSEQAAPTGCRASPTYEPMQGDDRPNATNASRDPDSQKPETEETNNAEPTNPAVGDGEEVTATIEGGSAAGGERALGAEGMQPLYRTKMSANSFRRHEFCRDRQARQWQWHDSTGWVRR